MLHRFSYRLIPAFRPVAPFPFVPAVSRYLSVLRSPAVWRWLFITFIAWTVLDTLLVHYRHDLAYQNHQLNKVKHDNSTRVYIASPHWNNERILRDSWNQGVLDLVTAFGSNNVFVSVYESGSWDGSKNALKELDQALKDLGVQRNITLDNTTHDDEIASPPSSPGNGWVKTPRGRIERRRIPYLARLRNLSLQPLREMAEHGIMFDYVLFLGDVVFSVFDVLTLLDTNNRDYAAACSLDFAEPPKFYDTFALRDATGHEYATQTWPYFRSSDSRAAMKKSQPVPVTSCWNGIVFMPTTPFIGDETISFRAIDDALAGSHLEGSECCLIHVDNPASATQDLYLNPNVRVGYNREAYDSVHSDGSWLSYSEIFIGLWKNRLVRWFTTPWFKEWRVRSLTHVWEGQSPDRTENGTMCMINEMHVLTTKGWAHV
ncbi:cryptococcal mannosyltransferase 1-domain-containing protein [Mariannaea sp. PMI_226]|nr:cryptococcal mannosyltransferase 1-domain-containing protein [Mariannaea sp. PMI_226]